MSTIDEGKVQVLTFKAGVLSRVAHDLELTLERFEISVAGDHVKGRFLLTSLRVAGALEHGVLRPEALTDKDRAEILSNVQNKILRTSLHPEARLDARATPLSQGYRVEGELELVGLRRDVAFVVQSRAGRLIGEVELSPLRWGIAPFKALLGAIKLEDRVLVRFDLVEPRDA